MRMSEQALALRARGNNCAYCVLASCGKYTGLDEVKMQAITAGFGGGMRSGETCGAITGAVMALGLTQDDPKQAAVLSRQCVESFRDAFGCVRCIELKRAGVPCNQLIAHGAEFIEKQLENR